MMARAEITFLPDNRRIAVRPGTTLLDAGKRAGAGIRTRCGGVAGCLMCKVKVSPGSKVSPPNPAELRKLGPMLEDGFRLACQTKAEGAVTVEVPEDPLKAAVREQLRRQAEERGRI